MKFTFCAKDAQKSLLKKNNPALTSKAIKKFPAPRATRRIIGGLGEDNT